MTYVIYDNSTTRLIGGYKTYKTLGSAKAAITRMQNKIPVSDMGKSDRDPVLMYSIAEINEYYNNIEKQVTRTNLMSGKEYQESINTPSYCSPASESYWSS
jgi:hypothetical protein